MIYIDLPDILKKFGNSMGMELAFDKEGLCTLLLDGETPVSIRASEEDGTLTFSAVLRDKLPDPLSYAALLDLLALAHDPLRQGGNSPVAGLDEESGFLILYEVATPSYLSKTPAVEIFTLFMETYEALAALLDEPVEASQAAFGSTMLQV
ncbi:MAG: CesT family type III secretion system chaperone [Desulfovibrio sp.]|jgi:hypothetical protein